MTNKKLNKILDQAFDYDFDIFMHWLLTIDFINKKAEELELAFLISRVASISFMHGYISNICESKK